MGNSMNEIAYVFSFLYSHERSNIMRSDSMSACKTWAMLAIVLFHYVRHLVSASERWSMLVMAWGIMAHVFFFVSWWWQFLSYDRWQQKQPWRWWTWRWIGWVIKKVYLPYIAFISLIGVVWWIWPQVFPPQSWNAFFSHVVGYKMFDAALLTSFGDHFWFLSPLLCLYALTPLLIFFIKKYPRLTLFSSCLISVTYGVWLVSADLFWWRQWQVGFPSFLWQYVVWMILAYRAWKPEDATSFVFSWRWGMLTIFLVLGYGVLSVRWWTFGRVVNDRFALPLVMMLCILASQCVFIKKLAVRWSGVSYCIFLVHGLWFMIWKRLMGGAISVSMTAYAFVSLLLVWWGMAWYQHRTLP